MNPGELKDVIDIYISETVRERGISNFNYICISEGLRCKVKIDKNRYFYANDSRHVNKTLIFITYKRKFIKEDNFIKYDGKMYRITDVSPFDNGLYYQVYAIRVE